MRTLTEVLRDMRHPYDGSAPADLLVETCRILASEVDMERAGGNGRVPVMVEELLRAYDQRIAELMRATARWLGASGEHVG